MYMYTGIFLWVLCVGLYMFICVGSVCMCMQVCHCGVVCVCVCRYISVLGSVCMNM